MVGARVEDWCERASTAQPSSQRSPSASFSTLMRRVIHVQVRRPGALNNGYFVKVI